MSDAIRRLERWLKANRPDYLAQLQPGATDAQLDELEATLDVKLPEALRELYKWRNGQPDDCYDGLSHNREFSNINTVRENWEMLTEMIGADFEHSHWWRRSWVPFLYNGGGDHVVVDVEGSFGGERGQVLRFWHDWEDRSIVAPSIQSWLEHFVIALETGVLRWNEEEEMVLEPDELDIVSWSKHLIDGYPVKVNLEDIPSE